MEGLKIKGLAAGAAGNAGDEKESCGGE